MSSPWKERRAGLSKSQRPFGLLKNIKGRREQGIDLLEEKSSPDQQVGNCHSSAASMSQSKNEKDEAWLARLPEESSDSEDDRHRNADIIPTRFGPQSKSDLPSSGNPREAAQGKEPSPKSEGVTVKALDDVQPTSASSKRPAADMYGSHLTDLAGFMKKAKVTKTFGKSTKKSNSKPTKRITTAKDDSPAKARFKVPETIDLSSPTKGEEQSRNLRRNPARSSPMSSPAKRKFAKNVVLDDSPEKTHKGFIMPDMDSGSPQRNRPARGTRNGRQVRKNGETPPEQDVQKEETSPLRTFKTHFLDDFEDLRDVPEGSSGLLLSTQQVERILDPEDAGLNSDSDLSSLDEALFPKEPRCPMCHELVDPELLRQHTAKGRMNVKNQTTFCRLHKRKEAEDAQRSNGYPKVDWNTLESRFGKHEEALRRILEGEQSSHHADTLREHVEAGENRTILSTEENLTPGYYGPRGLRVMADYIVKIFSNTLRKRAIEDHLVSARGYSGYVQAVLVPELAVRLIMDDMSVSEEQAKKIMSESRDVGELVHEETRDIIRWSDDDEGLN